MEKKQAKSEYITAKITVGNLKLFYEDNGVGISDTLRPKLFTEGLSTGKGTSYGLFLIKKVSRVLWLDN